MTTHQDLDKQSSKENNNSSLISLNAKWFLTPQSSTVNPSQTKDKHKDETNDKFKENDKPLFTSSNDLSYPLTRSSAVKQGPGEDQHEGETKKSFVKELADPAAHTSPTSPRHPPSLSSSTSAGSSNTADEMLYQFASHLLYKLTFEAVDYPAWASDKFQPLHYLPVPLIPMPDIPPIPEKIAISFVDIMDSDTFMFHINDVLKEHGYNLRCEDIWKVFISFTHKCGKRQRVAVAPENVDLLLKPWARDVQLEHLPHISQNCLCDNCQTTGAGALGHGIEIQVVFPQGVGLARRLGAYARPKPAKENQSWAGQPKLPLERGNVTNEKGKKRMPKKIRLSL